MSLSQATLQLTNRLYLVRLVFFIFLLVIVYKLGSLQILHYDFYSALASRQHDILSKLIPERGQIFVQDSTAGGKIYPVAVNRPLKLLFAVPREIQDAAAAARLLEPILKIPAADLESVLSKKNDPYEPLQHALPDEVAEQIQALNLSGLYLTPEITRYYPEGQTFAQILGFLGYVKDRQAGQYGVEQQWEKVLAGQPGKLKSEKDASGNLIGVGEMDMEPSVNGSDLVLTIDKNVQFKACAVLDQAVAKHGAAAGSLIILDPASGAIRALCNTPSFDPNDYKATTDLSSFANAAVEEAYEPGSVFKPITMAAALDKDKVTPETTYTDTGQVVVGSHIIKNSDNKTHGLQTMTNVLENSLNTGAVFAMRQIGSKDFTNYVQRFGFGQATGLELPHEHAGNIKALRQSSEINFVTASFGQGITVTPLQLAAAYGAIANQGRLFKPYLVEEVRYPGGKVEKFNGETVRQVIKPAVAATLSAMMVNVVEKGHGKRAGVPGYYVAGKTGTAQVAIPGGGGYDPNKTIGSFAGFAPVDKPKFVMVVKIREPKDVVFAESSAAPLFGEVAKYLLEYYQVPPEREIK